EGVRGEEDLIRLVVGHHDLGPVDHGGHDKGELVPAGAEHVALRDDVQPRIQVRVEVVLEHGLDLRVADDGRLRISERDVADGRRVVGLHVRDDKVVQAPATQLVGQVLEEVVADGLVYSVEEDGLFIFNKVGVIRNAVRHSVDTLEKGEASVVRAYPYHIVCYTLGAIHYIYTSYVCFSGCLHLIPKRKNCQSRFHFAPCGVSIIVMPSALSMSRMRSASAKFLAFLAAARSASRPSMRGSD